MNKLKNILISAVFWSFALVSGIVFFTISILVWVISSLSFNNLKLMHSYTCVWGSVYIWLNPFWNVKIIGRENIKKNTAYVLVSNHQSMLDILILGRVMRFFKWVSKTENFKAPIIGWVMHMNQYLGIKRGNTASANLLFDKAVGHLNRHTSIMIFPEGTRSETGEMRKFKDGAFIMAKRAEVAIIPIVLDGSGKALPKKGFILQGRQRMQIHILPEISVDCVRNSTIGELKSKTFAIMHEELINIRKI